MNVSDSVMVDIYRIEGDNAELLIALLKGERSNGTGEESSGKCNENLCEIDY